jgi:hypothetical protein
VAFSEKQYSLSSSSLTRDFFETLAIWLGIL